LGVSQTSNEQDFSVMLWLSDPDLERKSINKFLNNGLVDGFIIASMLMGDPIIEALKSTPRPFVLVGRQPALPDASVVDCDNVQGAYAATQHLLKTGRKRIATITGSEGMQSGINRIEGYQKALQDWGLTVNHALIAKGDYTEASGYFGMFQLLPEKPDAVFIASDNMAHGAYRALKEVGIRVPDDIAIVGFDDIPSADQMTPPLTTMRQPIRKMGNLAAEILINKINYPDTDSQRIILNPELVVRQSCGSSALAGSITLR
jgi:LacI family transcriptional regulator